MTTGKLQIIEPMTVTAMNSSYDSAPSTRLNMLTPDPKQIFASPNALAQDILFDLGSVQTLDSFFLGFTNAGSAATVALGTSTDLAGTGYVNRVGNTVIRAADAKSTRSSILLKAAAPFSSRYLYLSLGANTANWQIGRIAAGLAFEASWDREWGSGRRVIDTAKTQALIGGGFGVQPGVRKAAYQWTFGDLTDAETEQLYGIAYRVGNSGTIIVNEQDGTTVGANEKLHHGLFQRFEAFERRDPGATKWALEIEEWI